MLCIGRRAALLFYVPQRLSSAWCHGRFPFKSSKYQPSTIQPWLYLGMIDGIRGLSSDAYMMLHWAVWLGRRWSALCEVLWSFIWLRRGLGWPTPLHFWRGWDCILWVATLWYGRKRRWEDVWKHTNACQGLGTKYVIMLEPDNTVPFCSKPVISLCRSCGQKVKHALSWAFYGHMSNEKVVGCTCLAASRHSYIKRPPPADVGGLLVSIGLQTEYCACWVSFTLNVIQCCCYW